MSNSISHDSETPAVGQQVITACAFIHHCFDGVEKVFLPKRAETKKFLPGVYELPGGHVDFGEEPAVGLMREIMEEFGMHANIGDPFMAFTYTNHVKGSHSIEVVFFAEFEGPLDTIVLHPEDHSQFDWFSEAELPKAFTKNKQADDPEMIAIKKGFALLAGNKPAFS